MADQNYVNVPIIMGGTLPAGTTYIFAFPVPDDNEGGGITITSVETSSNYAIAAASAPILDVITTSALCAGSITGTIANCGSHDWGAGTLAAATLSTTWVDDDDSRVNVYVKWAQTEENAGTAAEGGATADDLRANLVIGYQQGR